jgi:hypothetical protein
MPQAAKPAAMLGSVARLEYVRAIGIKAGRGHMVHQAGLNQLALIPERDWRALNCDAESQARSIERIVTGLDRIMNMQYARMPTWLVA